MPHLKNGRPTFRWPHNKAPADALLLPLHVARRCAVRLRGLELENLQAAYQHACGMVQQVRSRFPATDELWWIEVKDSLGTSTAILPAMVLGAGNRSHGSPSIHIADGDVLNVGKGANARSGSCVIFLAGQRSAYSWRQDSMLNAVCKRRDEVCRENTRGLHSGPEPHVLSCPFRGCCGTPDG